MRWRGRPELAQAKIPLQCISVREMLVWAFLYFFMNPSQTWAPARQPILRGSPSSRLADPGWMQRMHASNAATLEATVKQTSGHGENVSVRLPACICSLTSPTGGPSTLAEMMFDE